MGQPNQYLANEKAFLRDREMLLRDHYGEFVVYNNGQLIEGCKNIDELNKLIKNLELRVDSLEEVYITGVNEGNFEKDIICPGDLPSLFGDL